jgi:hypothetical protein
LLVAALVLAGCDQGPQWQGWIYPSRHNLADHIAIGSFESLEQCRSAALARLEREAIYEDGEKIVGDYECGYKCEGSLCERTER